MQMTFQYRSFFRKSNQAPPLAPPEGFSVIRFFSGKPKKAQWTSSIAALVDKKIESDGAAKADTNHTSTVYLPEKQKYPSVPVGLRLEGPYFTSADPSIYRTVVCLVAGTGVSGGIAVANAFANIERQRAEGRTTPTSDGSTCDECGATRNMKGSACVVNSASGRWQKCILVWTVREEIHVDLPFFHDNPASSLELHTHLTGPNRPRLDMVKLLGDLDKEGGIWVYISGPNAFIAAAEEACKRTEGVEYYAARWDI